jgi:hypothetical protein
VIEMFTSMRTSLAAVGADIAAGFGGLGDDAVLAGLIRRNRGPLARAVATLLVDAVGELLTAEQRAAVRIGAYDDLRSR